MISRFETFASKFLHPFSFGLTIATSLLFTGCSSLPYAKGKPDEGLAANFSNFKMWVLGSPIVLTARDTDRGVQLILLDTRLFNFGSAELSEENSRPALDRIAELIIEKTDKPVSIEGHTDALGNLDLNQKLSDNRAAAIVTAFKNRGVPMSRLSAKGFASTQPIAPNDVEAGRKLNRRSEIFILGEKLINLTRGEPSNAFEDAMLRLKREIEAIKK